MKALLPLALSLTACLPPASSSTGPAGAANVARAPGELRGAPLRLVHVSGLAEVPDTRVVVRFENIGDTACVLHGYRLRWGDGRSRVFDGSVHCDAAAVAVPARSFIETTCTLASTTQLGGAPGMTVANTTIDEVQSTCTLRASVMNQ